MKGLGLELRFDVDTKVRERAKRVMEISEDFSENEDYYNNDNEFEEIEALINSINWSDIQDEEEF